jgi:uncharacterized protein YbjT (DUF2867 family)
MANVVILGGSGFLGSVLCEKLVERFGAANARILVPSRHPAPVSCRRRIGRHPSDIRPLPGLDYSR